MTNIGTVTQLRAAIKGVSDVFVQPRFGTSERWVRISKREALDLVAGLHKDATPESAEMGTGTFGTVMDGSILYLG